MSALHSACPRASLHSSLCSSCCRRREQESSQAAWLAQAESYENKHLGGFRRIYPAPGTEKYEPFFQQSRSLFQETASSKAREEYARYAAAVETHFSQVARRPLAPDPSWGAALLLAGVRKRGEWEGKGRSLHVLWHHSKEAPFRWTPERQGQ